MLSIMAALNATTWSLQIKNLNIKFLKNRLGQHYNQADIWIQHT